MYSQSGSMRRMSLLRECLVDSELDEASLFTNAAFKTAIHRKRPSVPAVRLMPIISQWIRMQTVNGKGVGDVLDYGCGTGADVAHYRAARLDADGYDPHTAFGFAQLPIRRYRVVTNIFVLNVIPTIDERIEILRRAAGCITPRGYLVVVTRSSEVVAHAAERGGWRHWQDGFVSHESRSTFQRGFNVQELRELGLLIGLRAGDELPQIPGAAVVAFTTAPDQD